MSTPSSIFPLDRPESGRWVVGVSGGADSVALLLALRRQRQDVQSVVAHLDHEMRGIDSDDDERFVLDLCRKLAVPCVSRRLHEFDLPDEPNLEARFRAGRLALFREVVQQHDCLGALVAQHADDRAETTLLRLLRTSEPSALDGLRPESTIDGIRIVRPLLSLFRTQLEAFLRELGQPWRTDLSNTSDAFARNRVRKVLAAHPGWTDRLLRLADAAGRWRDWVRGSAPAFSESIPTRSLADLPDPLARYATRAWLRGRGVAVDAVAPRQIADVIALARDRSTPPTVNLPGGKTARRHQSRIEIV